MLYLVIFAFILLFLSLLGHFTRFRRLKLAFHPKEIEWQSLTSQADSLLKILEQKVDEMRARQTDISERSEDSGIVDYMPSLEAEPKGEYSPSIELSVYIGPVLKGPKTRVRQKGTEEFYAIDSLNDWFWVRSRIDRAVRKTHLRAENGKNIAI